MNNTIEIYRSQDGSVQLNVKLENDTVWLNRQQMAELFGRDYKTVSKHINNALREELEGEPVVAKFATPKNYGRVEGMTQDQMVEYFSLEMITSVGYRVKSKQGVAFRKWANSVLKQYLIKGYAINQQLKLDRYNEFKDVVRLMGRAIGMQEKVSTDEYSGLFNVIPWFQSMFRMITRDFFVPLSPKSATTGLLSFQGDCFKRRLYHYLHKRNEKFY